MEKIKKDTSKATQASVLNRRLSRFRRMADELRANGWAVNEPQRESEKSSQNT